MSHPMITLKGLLPGVSCFPAKGGTSEDNPLIIIGYLHLFVKVRLDGIDLFFGYFTHEMTMLDISFSAP